MRTLNLLAVAVLTAVLVALPCAAQVVIDPTRGADPRVDYRSLKRLGPWDDRNYNLTRADLVVLAPNESELRDPIPAFFRVAMRKAWPGLPTSGPAQYPRSALNIFRQMYGGYLVDGKLYDEVRRAPGGFEVVLEGGIAPGEASPEPATRLLTGEVRVTSPEGAAESAIKINPVDPGKVIAGSNGPGGGQKMHYSQDGGETWTETVLPGGGTCCDPTVDWSADGALAYAATLGGCNMSGCGVWFYRSDDGGQSWNGLESLTPGDPRRELTSGGSDKEYIHVDKHPTSPFKDNVYVTWHDGNVMQFAVSGDNGNTFTTQSFSSLTEDRGIGSDITTDAVGNVYYIWPGFQSRTIRLRKSIDGGVSFGATSVIATTEAGFTFPVPSIDVREVFVYVSADADLGTGPFSGSVYAAWTDSTGPESTTPSANHARVQVAYSRDGGASWTVTTPHETADALAVDRWHPWLAVDDAGRVHVVFYDTRRDPSRTSVDLFYSVSNDGAQTWSVPERVTSEMSPKINDSFEFGDYNGLDVVMNDLIAIFTDNRDESGGASESVDVYAGGKSICPQPSSPVLSIGSVASGAVDLGWSPIAVVDSYRIYRSDSACGEAGTLLATTTSTSFTDTSVLAGGRHHYTVRSELDACESDPSNCVTATLAPEPVYDSHRSCDGNGDGYVDPGEGVVMPVTVFNNGDFGATNVVATLSTTTPGVSIDDSSAGFPDLVPKSPSESVPTHFSFAVDAAVPCNTRVEFRLDVSATEGTWSSPFQAVVGQAVPVDGVANQTGGSMLQRNLASWIALAPDLTVPGPASEVAVVTPSLSGYGSGEVQGLVQLAAVSPTGAVSVLKPCGDSLQSSYDITAFYNGPDGGPGTWSLCVSTGDATECTGSGCNKQVGPWPDLDVVGASLSASGTTATCSPNPGVGTCGPGEISSVPAAEPPLTLLSGSPDSLTIESDPAVTAYNVYVDGLGDWFTDPARTCGVTGWTDNGDGTVTLDLVIPDNAWVLVSGSNADGEGPLGGGALGTERAQTGSWSLCGAGQ